MQLYISEFRLFNVGKLITNNYEIRVLCLTDHRTSFYAAVQSKHLTFTKPGVPLNFPWLINVYLYIAHIAQFCF
jgi:hypothetical protein